MTGASHTMKALRCFAPKGELTFEHIPAPVLRNTDDVLIKVAYAGLCGTDLHIISVRLTVSLSIVIHLWKQGEFAVVGNNKVTISHEFAGTVIEVGEEAANKFKIGDRVGVDPNRC